MKYFYFEGSMNHSNEQIRELIAFCEEEGQKSIYIDSCGGTTYLTYVLLDVMNRDKDNIILHGVGNIQSAACDLWLRYQGRKHVSPGIIGMVHEPWIKVAYGITSAATSKPAGIQDKDESYLIDCRKYTRPILSAAEWRKFLKGEDIYLYYDRLNQIAKKHNQNL